MARSGTGGFRRGPDLHQRLPGNTLPLLLGPETNRPPDPCRTGGYKYLLGPGETSSSRNSIGADATEVFLLLVFSTMYVWGSCF